METFWALWRATEGADGDNAFWSAVAPALVRLDALLADQALDGVHRGSIAPLVIALRQARGAPRHQVAGQLRSLANVIMSLTDGDYEFRPAQLKTRDYLKFLRAVARADREEPQTLNHCTAASDVARYGRLDLATVEVGVGQMVDEGIAEYEFDPPHCSEVAFRILDDVELSARIDELEEKMTLSVKATVTHAEPLRADYQDVVKGLAMKHELMAQGHPTGNGELVLTVSDHGGDTEAFKANVIAFATELETALSKATPHAQTHTSVTFHGPVIGSPVQAGSPGATQQARTTIDMGSVRDTFVEAKRALSVTQLDDDTREIVDAQIEAVGKQLAKGSPNPKLLLPMVTTIATALGTVGAAGQGVELIGKLLHLLSLGA
ncbi:MAG: hypothetical protein KBG48_16390 [Kofleriaceae bacterium]|nr:hypothetical protein [Kofleriaceae bacterium]MBP9168979.1 hypothetical protein [Kofleriaceae bacterium]MBP9858832.1 hypothetical protein [Kofleriaceae bacterium]